MVSEFNLIYFLNGFKKYMVTRMELFQLVLIKFYNVNKKYLENININLIQVLVSSNCIELLEYHISQTPKSINKLTDKSTLYEMALKNGHLKMVVYLKEKLEIQYKEKGFLQNAFYWSIHSENRNEIVSYLINQMDYIPPVTYKSVIVLHDFFKYFIQLDYKLLKSIILNGADFKYEADILYSSKLYTETLPNLSLNQLINFIKSSIFINIHLNTIRESKDFKILLKSINKLIRYNEITDKQEQDLFIKQYKSNFGDIEKTMVIKREFLNSMDNNSGSIFSKLKSYITSNQTVQSSFFKSLLVTNFNDFNLSREIKRIYLLFLLRNESMVDSYTMSMLIVDFVSCFGEYNLIMELDQFKYRLMKNNTIIDTCQKVATCNADAQLVVYTFDNFSKGTDLFFNYNNFGYNKFNKFQLFNCENIFVEQQIHYFSILILYNINYPVSFSEVLKNIFSNNKGKLTIDHLDKITTLIETSYQLQLDKGSSFPKKFQALILIDNQFVADYYLNTNQPHKKELFHNWNTYYSLKK